MPVGEKQTYRFGPFELATQCGQLRKDGVGLKLQGQPVSILEILLEHPGQLVTREELRQRLWASDTFVDFDHSLNTAIKKLRQALGDEADTPRYIETLPRRGYRFIGEVVHEPKPDNQDTAAVAVPPLGQLEPWSSIRLRLRKRVIVSSALTLLVFAIGVGAYYALKTEPMPRIVGVHALTKTGNLKSLVYKPLLVRGSIYFYSAGSSGPVASQVSTAGGEVSQGMGVSNYFSSAESNILWPMDVSRDESELLFVMYPIHDTCDLWAQPLPLGTPHLLIKNACFPLWSLDNHGIFFVRRNDTGLYRANADGAGIKRLATIPGFSLPHLSPDGSHIRFTDGSSSTFTLWEIRADGSNLHQLLNGRKDVWGGSWSLDGKRYFFSSWDGDRWSIFSTPEAHSWWKKAADSYPRPMTFGPMSFGTPTISKDGRHLYAVGKEPHGELSVYDSRLAKFVSYLGGISICYVDFSRDGQWIAYVTYPEGTLWRSRIDGSERRQLTVPPLAVQNPRWSPDGKLIAFTDLSNGDRSQMRDDTPGRIYVISADGGGPELLLAGYVGDPTWSPDGDFIAYGYGPNGAGSPGSEVRIFSLKTQKSTTVRGSLGMWSPRWSPDGRYLVALFADPSKKLVLYNFASNTWRELRTGEGFGWPCWSRDSRFVYALDANSLARIDISNDRKEPIASLEGFRPTAYYLDRWNAGWFGLTPDSRLITTRDTGIEELYAFDLEYK